MKKQYFISLLLVLFSVIGYAETITRIEAETYSGNSGAKKETNAALSGGGNVGYIKNGTWIKFTEQVFDQYDTRFDILASGATGGNIEFRLDSTTGTLIGTAAVSGSSGFSDYKTFSTAITQTTGTHDLYLVFKHPTNTGYLFNIDYFEKITSDPNAATFTLTTNVSPASTGTISANPGGTSFLQGTVVTLTATDNFRYNFVQWVDENGAVVSTNSTIAVTMTANTTRIAQFQAVTFPDIPSTQMQPNIPSTQYVITELIYGGSTSNLDNSAAINAAINAANAAGGGTVVIPAAASPFLSGPITMKSNVNLFISAGATLQLMPYGNGNGLPAGSYPNSGTADTYTTFIYGENLTNIKISGKGTIEGNGSAWWTAFDATGIGRPGIIRFKACNTVLITDITIQNAPNVSITMGKSGSGQGSKGTIKNVTVIAPSSAPNTDALDIWYWNGLDVLNCYFSVGDDNVAVDTNSQNVTVKNSSFGDGHGVSVGSYTSNVSNLIVDNCSFIGTSNGFRLKSNNTRGGGETSFTYSNVTMRNVSTPFAITSWYPKEPTAAPSTLVAGTVTSTTPAWKNITFKNITVTNSDNAGIIYALPESFATNVVFDNVKISANTKGMVANFVTGLVFQNCSSITIPGGKGDAIIPYKAETVNGSNIINGINTTTGASTSCNLSVGDVSFTNNFSFYPNPVKGGNFTINADSGIEKIVIYNFSGAKIKELNGNNSTQQTIDAEGFSAGCYLVQIMLDNGKINTAKFIKE
ncbi:glycosyl hydrolase family 28 protein [Flavobacterium sp. CF136]|uniref:glycosyl hydrolase family 28 protein n=1 Tax=Flavobacterium sp. (strain CF136) TaxID=1144313 RepID=UPI0002716BA0|nr:glycosyl hydrolase family 28 protein [Flavobacterium sp. CF136]EJL64079.1 Por secretion system C-terminal sorting domain-containing protein [Flavobacterium sp. CF136]